VYGSNNEIEYQFEYALPATKSQLKATKLAKDLTNKCKYVYVSFSENENYNGYLNRDGNHDITGKNWNSDSE
jgi:hypothetical protein